VPRSDCTIKGTNGNDVLIGTNRADVICGFGGNDTIDGRRGADTLSGGADNDAIEGGPGADDLFGGNDDDALDAKDGVRRNDFSSGGEGKDGCVSDRGDREVSCL
jgi:Ca2+-binding RTX toxin-like protein